MSGSLRSRSMTTARTADVVIIGGGVTGLSAAFHLTRRGIRNVVVLDKGTIASGGTGKSSACVRQHYSTAETCRMIRYSLEFFQHFAERVARGSCGFRHTGSLLGVDDNMRMPRGASVALQRSIGTDARLVSPVELRELELRPRAAVDPDAYKEGVSLDESTDALARVSHRFPALAEGHIARGYAGCFDVTPDWHPILDRVGPEGYYVAAGFSGHGFKLSPAVGHMVAALVAERATAQPDLPTFPLPRFAEGKPIRGTYGDWLMC